MSKHPLRRFSEENNPRCLHCVINYAIGSWARHNAPRSASDGVLGVTLDVTMAIAKIAEVIGELVYSSNIESERAEFERYAHECLEGAFLHERTGEKVAVSVNDKPPS